PGQRVPALAAARAHAAPAPQGEEILGRDARRHLDLDVPLFPHSPLAPARRAGLRDHASLALARPARLHTHELAEDRPLHVPLLAGPAAHRARLRCGSWLGARAVARLARVEQGDPDRFRDARGDLGQSELQPHTHRLPLPGRRPLTAGAPHAEQVLDAREAAATPPAEIAHEDLDRVREVEAAESAGASGASLQPLLPVAVVDRAL